MATEDLLRSRTPSLLNIPSWCNVEKGKRIHQDICLLEKYTETGGLEIIVNSSVVDVPVHLRFVDSL